jgi:uncharacterized OB-fold protein
MSFALRRCVSCDHSVFPPRALCPRCGSREWVEERVDAGVVIAATSRDGVMIAAVRTEPGPVLVTLVKAADLPEPGVTVTLFDERGLPVARSPGIAQHN